MPMALLLLTLAVLLLGPPLFVAAAVSLLRWYETENEPPCPIGAPCKDKKLRCALTGLLTCMASQMAAIGVFFLGYVPWLWRPAKNAARNKPAVILIHGLYHNPGAFIRFRRILRRAGFARLYMPRYFSYGAKTFEEIAADLRAQARAVIATEGPVLFVGHSMGGLLIRALCGDPVIAANTLGAVTLGTPHQGSKLAVLAFGASGRAITRHSPLIRRLAKAERPMDVPRLSLASPMDDMVLPVGALTPPPGWELELTAPVGHVYMLYHAPVIRRVLRFLEDAAGRTAPSVIHAAIPGTCQTLLAEDRRPPN